MKIRILLLFLASGFSGLVYEIVWVKLFSLSFGNTIYAVSTVLAAFMLGLSAGGFLFGKVSTKRDEGLRLFAFMEGGVALSALAIVLFFPFLDSLYVYLHHEFSLTPEGSTLLRFLSSFVILLVPSLLMGGTLPVLSRCLIHGLDLAGTEISRLYGINTFGACLGCFVTGYFLIPYLGTTHTQYLAIAVNLSVAAIAFAGQKDFAGIYLSEEAGAPAVHDSAKQGKKKKQKAKEKEPVISLEATKQPLSRELILLFSGLAGFCGLAYEVLWTRAFSLIFKSTVYLFSNILTVFLLGIAIGSLCYQKLLEKRESPLRYFGWLQLAIGCYALFSILLFAWMPGEVGEGGQWTGATAWGSHILRLFALNFLVLIVPTFLMGMAFPLICKAYISSVDEAGGGVGRMYSANVFGGIFGSIAAGFFLIPVLGLQWGIIIIAFVNMAAGALAILKSGPREGFGLPGYAMGLASLVFLFSGILAEKDIGSGPDMGGEAVYKKEGSAGTVKVVQEKGGKALTLTVNNYHMATTGDVAVRFGHLPLLFHPDPKEVLAISLGAGITAGAVGQHEEVEWIDCVEIVPELVETAAFFKESNHGIISNPKFHLAIWDGRNFVRTVQRKYDVIISDLFQPDTSGSGNLYSREHYENCLAKLKPGGLMAQWLPLYQLHPDDLKTIVATFASVFPKITLWYGDTNSSKPTLMLLGGREDLQLAPDALREKMKNNQVRKDLIEWADPFSLLSFFITDQDGLKEFLKDAVINTDEHPAIEYSAPKHIWSRQSDAVKNFREFSHIRSSFKGFPESLPAEDRSKALEKTAKYFEGRSLLLKGRIAHAEGDFQEEIKQYQRSEAVNPSDPYLGFSNFELGLLYLQQGRQREALRFLEKAAAFAPQLPEAHYYLSKVYSDMGETGKAEKEYGLAVEALK
ncbi:MAG: fused MFS/spermidine synthase [Nitrospinae bacterium]|nr:fused MFS/spermidine synthase [Nitrospinota bacterium]